MGRTARSVTGILATSLLPALVGILPLAGQDLPSADRGSAGLPAEPAPAGSVALDRFSGESADTTSRAERHRQRTALEFSPVMVPVGFYGFRLVHAVAADGNVMVGYMYQNFTNDWGQSHAHTVLLGYQHFIWRGLHGEVELWPAYNRWRSSVDDQVYPGFEVWGEGRVGYRVDVRTFGRRWYVLPQVLFGTGIWREASPPGPENGTFVFPVLWVGVPFR